MKVQFVYPNEFKVILDTCELSLLTQYALERGNSIEDTLWLFIRRRLNEITNELA